MGWFLARKSGFFEIRAKASLPTRGFLDGGLRSAIAQAVDQAVWSRAKAAKAMVSAGKARIHCRVVGVALPPGIAGKALGPADIDPVGGAVAGTGKARSLDESLRQDDGVAIDSLPIRRQAAQVQRQNAGGEVGEGFAGQEQETSIVGDQVQALAQERQGPADPFIPSPTVERRSLPAQQGDPAIVNSRDITESTAASVRKPR